MTEFSFPKAEKLKLRKSIQLLFEKGSSINCPPVRVIYKIHKNENSQLLFGVTVPRKLISKATDRNKIKRQLREAYRTQKHELKTNLTGQGLSMEMMWVFQSGEKIEFKKLRLVVSDALAKLNSKINQAGNRPKGD